ncbi:hypothetical protein BKA63DRAFT_489995 [Paraphoma chrysanthemicola]|nr:hypothetical protein BKA63DRAFT_489995 [Paraphoma chrysanthemicola]
MSLQLQPRQTPRSPCPISTPTQIGSKDPYQILCNLDLPGSDSQQLPASSLVECAQLCTSNPPCIAISYDSSAAHGPKNCYLKSGAVPAAKQQSFVVDSAIAIPHDVRNVCGPIPSVAGVRFEQYCGVDHPGKDMPDGNPHAKSLNACAGLCAQRSGCRGVSFDGAMMYGQGYFNCYLKSETSEAGLVKQAFDMDSALVVDGEVSSMVIVSSLPFPSFGVKPSSVGPMSYSSVQTVSVKTTSSVGIGGTPTSSAIAGTASVAAAGGSMAVCTRRTTGLYGLAVLVLLHVAAAVQA